MATPPAIFPAQPRRHRKRKPAAAAPMPPVEPLTLVEAEFDNGGAVPFAQLRFDRAIDIASIDVEQVTVDDGLSSGLRYRGTGAATLIDPATVRIDLADYDLWFVPTLTLSATGATGIVAVDDGGLGAGVSGVGLPFP